MKEKVIEEILSSSYKINHKKLNFSFTKNNILYEIIYLSYNYLYYYVSYKGKSEKEWTETNNKNYIKDILQNLSLLQLQYIKISLC